MYQHVGTCGYRLAHVPTRWRGISVVSCCREIETGVSPWSLSEEEAPTLGEGAVVGQGLVLHFGLGCQMVEELVEIETHHDPVPRGQGRLVRLHFAPA